MYRELLRDDLEQKSAARRMHVEREQACDELVIANGAKASDYAQEPLDMAANYHDRPLMALAAAPMARLFALEGRLRSVLDGKKNRTALTAMTGLLALSLLAAVLVPLAMVQASEPRPPAAKPDPKSQATDAPPVVRAPAPAKPAAPMNGIRLSVFNSKGDGPIKEFRSWSGRYLTVVPPEKLVYIRPPSG